MTSVRRGVRGPVAAAPRPAPRGGWRGIAAVAGLCAALAGVDGAAAAEGRLIEFRLDNDQFAFTPGADERWYTQGALLRWGEDATPGSWAHGIARAWCARVAGCAADTRFRRTVTLLGQALYTPANFGSTQPQPLDRPYAASLYVGAEVAAAGPRVRDALELRLGVVGPAALGEWTQNTLHGLIGEGDAGGWDYQVRAQALVELQASRVARAALPWSGTEAAVRASVQLGTPVTQLAAGALVRAGALPAVAQWPGDAARAVSGPAGTWQLFAGAELRAVLRNQLIDGDTYGYVGQVRSERWVGELFAGGAIAVAPEWELQLSITWRSVEFETDGPSAPLEPQRYGSIAVRWTPR